MAGTLEARRAAAELLTLTESRHEVPPEPGKSSGPRIVSRVLLDQWNTSEGTMVSFVPAVQENN